MVNLIRLLLIYFLFILGLVNCSETIYDNTDPNIKMNAGVYLYKEQFLTGIIKSYIPALQETELASFRNGIQHGEYKIITRDGKLLQKMDFRNGKKEGFSKAWYHNGKLRAFAEFKNGEYINDRIDYFDNSQVASYEKYSENSKIQVVKKWYRNGKIYMNISFKEDGSSYGLPGSKLCDPIKKTKEKELITK